MLLELLNENTIQIDHSVTSWEDAIRISANPLLKNGSIKLEYVTAMIESVNQFGPYIVIAPKVALPHARPEKGALKIGLSLLINRTGVKFSDDPEHFVQLLFALSATDSQSHIKALTELSDLLGDEDAIAQLIKCDSVADVHDVIKQFVNL